MQSDSKSRVELSVDFSPFMLWLKGLKDATPERVIDEVSRCKFVLASESKKGAAHYTVEPRAIRKDDAS